MSHFFVLFFFPKCFDVWSKQASNQSDSSVLVFVVLRYTCALFGVPGRRTPKGQEIDNGGTN